jgi:hypothetical protein
MRAFAIVLAIVAAAACGKSKKDEDGKKADDRAVPVPAPAHPEPAAVPGASSTMPSSEEQVTADKAAVVLEELGKIAETSRGNCEKAATAMKSVIDKNRSVLSAAEKLGQDEGKEQWLSEKYGPRTDAAKSKLMPLMEKCAEHEGISTVFDSIE